MKEFLLNHAEKLALGLCVLIAGYLLYLALTAKGYEKTPEDFAGAIGRARANVENPNSKPPPVDLTRLDLQAEYAKLGKTLDSSAYPLGQHPFIKPYELRYSFRDQPAILAPVNIAASANGGLFLRSGVKSKSDPKVFQTLWAEKKHPELIWFFGNDDAKEALGIVEDTKKADGPKRPADRAAAEEDEPAVATSSESRFWVEIVADFPHGQQLYEFHRALRESIPEAGLRYALVEVERRELNESLEWTEWEPIDWNKMFDLMESAEERQKPMEEFSWGVVRGLVMEIPNRAVAAEGDSENKPIWVQMHDSLAASAFSVDSEPDWKPDELNYSKENSTVTTASDKPREIEAAERTGEAPEKQKSPSGDFDNFQNVLTAGIRVWDATVVPGRRYEYRIRVVAFNPNYNRPDVVDPAYAVPIYLEGPWSDPVEVYVEPRTEWFVDKTDSMKRNEVELVIYHWTDDMGAFVPIEMLQQTGQRVGESRSKAGEKADYAKYDSSSGRMVVTEGVVEAKASSVLLEVSPGRIERTLPGIERKIVIRPPKEVIVVNEYGDLMRRSEIHDGTDENEVRSERQSTFDNLMELIRTNKGSGRRPDQPKKPDDDKGLENPFGDKPK